MAQIPVDFGFREEHDLLRKEARRLLTERCTLADIRRLAEDARGYDAALWKELGALGWMGLALPEAHGGAGLGYVPLVLLLDEMGRRLLPSPYLASLFAAFAVEAGGSEAQQARWLPALASGERSGALALTETGGGFEAGSVHATAEPSEGGFVLRGQKSHVLSAQDAGFLVAPFREPSGAVSLFAVELPAKGVVVEPETGVDPTRRCARVAFDGVRVSKDARLEGGERALRATHLRATVALAAEMVGAADAALEMTRQYAVDRKQFGRQIGFFQAVKHPIVDVMIGVELARNHVLGAAAALDHAGPAEAEIAVRMAKALASDVFATAVRKGVQLHGGYGFTIDCDMHFYFKRALYSRATLGDAAHHRRHLAAILMDGGTAEAAG